MLMKLASLEKFARRLSISNDELTDLNRRLKQTRWPLSPDGDPWEYGTSLAYLQEVVDTWLHDFDWRIQEQRLNRYSHIAVPISGRIVHAVVIPSKEGQRPPVLLAHGWPGSFVEFLNVGERLAHPEQFGGIAAEGSTVIIPSLPGCGLSSAPAVPIAPRDIAKDWHRLMTDTLDISKLVVHGGDWGAAVASWLAVDAADMVNGIHLTSAIIQPSLDAEENLSDDEQSFLNDRASRGPWDSGYRVMQGTKPLTLSYGLTDSPAGLAAWLLEKFQSWGAAHGTGNPPDISLDDLLTIISLYWFAGPGPSTWIYRSWVNGTALKFPAGVRAEVPTAICSFEHDISPVSPDAWQQRCYNVVKRSNIDHGGHFPGLDAPLALAQDIQEFVGEISKN
jgi:pimeloyl-ACP methyl ester carboxylesterase